MIRRVTSLGFGFAISLMALNAFAQDEGGDAPAGDAAEGESAEPAKEAPKADAGGDAAASASASSADAGGKIKIGLRLGYALPLGKATDTPSGELNKVVSGMIPIWLDLGYMVTPNIMIGLYAQYGLVMIKSADTATDPGCPSGADCSGNDIRIGLQGQYHISPAASLDPWVGLGIGYEMLNYKVSANGQEGKFGVKGLEFANIQGGADFKLADSFTVGPFLSFSLGQFSSQSADPEPPGFNSSIDKTAMHEWLTLGVKGTFGL
jgi:outer membrane protein W